MGETNETERVLGWTARGATAGRDKDAKHNASNWTASVFRLPFLLTSFNKSLTVVQISRELDVSAVKVA